ncbi:hypothetical protein RGQ29_026154 [Quercus rubra]|uniref:Uncharacterized protein n=1 Tax=Quercus rubra TaxID=3512 RepID=A0AAN7IMW7_QUERU|nr:hypothetical protein RGQ29_026154 [Quercus rubra]
MDLDLIQIHPGFEASKYLDFKASHVLLQGSALFYVLKLKPPSLPGVQVPSHQTRFIPCHISIRYITIGKHPSLIHKWWSKTIFHAETIIKLLYEQQIQPIVFSFRS